MTDEAHAFDDGMQEPATPSLDARFQSLLDSDGVIRRRRVVAASLPEIQHAIDRAVRTLQAEFDQIHARITVLEESLTTPPPPAPASETSPTSNPDGSW